MAQAQAVVPFSISAGSTTAVNIDLTGLWSDGGCHTPHAYRTYWRNGAAGTGTGDAFWGKGMSDGSRHYSIGIAIDDGAISSNAGRYTTADGPIVESDLTGAVTCTVAHTSFAADT